jgi:type III secretion protein L
MGKVLKRDLSPDPHGDASRSSLRSSRTGDVLDADPIVDAARKQAQEILEAASREKERIFSEARAAGRDEGLALVSEQILRAKIAHGEILASSERDLVVLALKIAEKILGRDLEREPSLVVDICARAVEIDRAAHHVVVRVNPQDAAILREQRGRMMELIGRVKEIAIKEDGDVPLHGCIVETESGVFDARLATQFEVLRRILLGDSTKTEGRV